MKKFKIVNRGGGVVTIMDEDGDITYVNEGIFHDTYVKIKDSAIKFKEMAGRIVAYIGNKVLDIVSVFDIAKRHKESVILFGGPSTVSTAQSLGVKTGTNADLDALISKENPYDLLHMIFDAIGQRILKHNNSDNTDESVNEAHFVPRGDTAAQKRAYASIAGTNAKERNDIKKWLDSRGEGVNDQLDKLFSEGKYYTTKECETAIMSYISSIFNKKIEEKSYEKGYSRYDSTIKIPILYGPGGVGKTSLVKRVINTLLSNAEEGEEHGTIDKRKDYTGLNQSLSKYRAEKYNLEVSANFDLNNPSTVMREPKMMFIKCQNLTDVDVNLPAKAAGVNVERRDSSLIKITDEAVRNLTTGLLPLIDTQGKSPEEIMEADEAFGPVLLVFDELFMASPEFLSIMMGLVDSRKVGSMYLPTKCAMIATTNRFEDFPRKSLASENITNTITPQFLDRLSVYPLLPTWEEFREWATKANTDNIGGFNINPMIFSVFDDSVDFRHCMINVFSSVSGTGGITRRTTSNIRSIEFLSNEFEDLYYGRNSREEGYEYIITHATDQEAKERAMNDFLSILQDIVHENFPEKDATGIFAILKSEVEGVPANVFKDLWTKYTGNVIKYERISPKYDVSSELGDDVSDADRQKKIKEARTYLFNRAESPIGTQRLVKAIFNNRPQDYDKKCFDNNDDTITKYHENLKNNMFLYYNTTNDIDDAVIDLRSFGITLLTRVLEYMDNDMIAKGYYDKNTPIANKFHIIAGTGVKNGEDGMLSKNNKSMPKLPWGTIKTPQGVKALVERL